MNLPTQYQWLTKLKGLPNTIRLGLKEFGVKEVVGRGSNATIIGWRDQLNLAGVPIKGFSDDDIAWCGLFVAFIAWMRMKVAGEVVKDPLWARNWSRYGVEVSTRRGGKLVHVRGRVPSLGDVLVFERGDGGHVGFYVGEDSACFHVLGGNQGNRVSIVRMDKGRCLAVRRPPYVNPPAAMKPYRLAATGAISRNEA